MLTQLETSASHRSFLQEAKELRAIQLGNISRPGLASFAAVRAAAVNLHMRCQQCETCLKAQVSLQAVLLAMIKPRKQAVSLMKPTCRPATSAASAYVLQQQLRLDIQGPSWPSWEVQHVEQRSSCIGRSTRSGTPVPSPHMTQCA